MVYYWDKKLKRSWHVLPVDVITIKKTMKYLELKGCIFLQYMIKMTTIVLFLVIKYYNIKWLESISRYPTNI